MPLPDEPHGWSRLQTLAQSATDSHSLQLIIDQMNRLLDRAKCLIAQTDDSEVLSDRKPELHCHPDLEMEVAD